MLFQGSLLPRVFVKSIRSRSLFASSTFLLCLALTGCNQYSENGLVGDYVAASKCPPNGCADQAPDPNYISLKSAVPSIIVTNGERRAELAGDCYPSTYPKNQINVSVVQSTGAAANASVVNTSTDLVAPMCKNGRFNLVLGTDALAPGFSYIVRLELIGIDSAGGKHNNVAGGIATISLRK